VTDYCYINKKSDIWGLQKFIKKSAFYAIDRNSNKNFIKDNKCIVGVYLNIYKNDKGSYLLNKLIILMLVQILDINISIKRYDKK